jgi:large-conductance mechanosensitive channel
MLKLLAQAQQINLQPPGQFSNLIAINFGGLVQLAINFILILAAITFFFMLVLGGIKWITSGGDKGKTESARSQITAGLIGLVIVFAAWAILSLVENFFGVDLRNFEINF